MLKCLILAYDFQPYTSMGAQRPFGWYNYFKEYGIEPTVVTRQWPNEITSKLDYSRSVGSKTEVSLTEKGVIYKVPYFANLRDRILLKFGFDKKQKLRKALSFIQSILQFAHYRFDNKSGIYLEARKLLKNESFDIIIATGEPFILFRYAYLLNKEFNIPWVADYRDCWSGNFEINRIGGPNKFIHQSLFKYLEKKYVNTSAVIITAAPFFQKQLRLLFPNKDVKVIYNGYLKEQFENLESSYQRNKEITIGFAGTIYPFQPIEIFLEGFRDFIMRNPEARIKVFFYGSNYLPDQKSRILNYNKALASHIETTDRLTQEDLFNRLRCADILLLLDNKGMISGKLYEYLAMKKVILMAGRDYGSMEQIIHDCNAGAVCEDACSIVEKIGQLYQEWKQNGEITCKSGNIEHYSRKHQTKRFTQLLKDL